MFAGGSTCNHNYLYRWLPCQYFILLMMGAWRPKHVEKVCSNKICILLHHVGVLFNLKTYFVWYDLLLGTVHLDDGIRGWILLRSRVFAFLLHPFQLIFHDPATSDSHMEPNIRSSKTLLTNPRINPTSRWSSSGCVRATILCVYQHAVCVCTGCVYTRCCVAVVCHFKGPVCLHSFPLNWDVIDVKSALVLWYFNASRRNCFHGIRHATGISLVELRPTRNKCSFSRPFVFRRLLTRFALFWDFMQSRVVISYRRLGTTIGLIFKRLLDTWSLVVFPFRRFGTTYPTHLQGWSSLRLLDPWRQDR